MDDVERTTASMGVSVRGGRRGAAERPRTIHEAPHGAAATRARTIRAGAPRRDTSVGSDFCWRVIAWRSQRYRGGHAGPSGELLGDFRGSQGRCLGLFGTHASYSQRSLGHAAAATRNVLGSCSDTSDALQRRFWGRGRLNWRSRKGRRFRPCSASNMPEALGSTADAIWRKCVVFAKTRFAASGPNSSSRRRPRGAKGRFEPLGPCTKRGMLEVTLGQQGPLEHIARLTSRTEPAHSVTRT